MHFKKTFYISAFVILGIFLSFIVHAAIELPILKLFVKDFDTYGLGLSWKQWLLIHHTGSILLFILGATAGYWQGKRWWEVIYVEKRRKIN